MSIVDIAITVIVFGIAYWFFVIFPKGDPAEHMQRKHKTDPSLKAGTGAHVTQGDDYSYSDAYAQYMEPPKMHDAWHDQREIETQTVETHSQPVWGRILAGVGRSENESEKNRDS